MVLSTIMMAGNNTGCGMQPASISAVCASTCMRGVAVLLVEQQAELLGVILLLCIPNTMSRAGSYKGCLG